MKKLRAALQRQGSTLSVGALGGLLAQHAGETASNVLVVSIQATCLGTAGTASNALGIAEVTMKTLFWAKVKTMALLCAAGAALLAIGLVLPGMFQAPVGVAAKNQTGGKKTVQVSGADVRSAAGGDTGGKSIADGYFPFEKSDKVDLYGDPLPKGAMARLGTLRFRTGVWIGRLCFTKDGTQIITNNEDDRAQWWDVVSGKLLRQISDVSDISPSGRYLRGSEMGTCFIRDLETNKEVIHADNVKDYWSNRTGGCFSCDESMFAVPGNDTKSIRLWQLPAGRELPSLHLPYMLSSAIIGNGFDFSPDGKHFAAWVDSGENDTTISHLCIWNDVAHVNPDHVLDGISGPLAFSPNGEVVAACVGLPTYRFGRRLPSVVFIDAKSGQERFRLPMQQPEIGYICFSPDGKTVAIAVGGSLGSGSIQLWNLDSKTMTCNIPCGMETMNLMHVAFSADGSKVLWGASGGVIHLYSLAAGKDEWTAGVGHVMPVVSVCFSTDGDRVVTAGGDGSILWWNVAQSKIVMDHTFPLTEEHQMASPSFTCNGQSFYMANTAKIERWDFDSGNKMCEYDSKPELYRIVTPTWDGKLLLAANSDRVFIWNAVDLKMQAEININRIILGDRAKNFESGEQYSQAFSDDGRLYAIHWEYALDPAHDPGNNAKSNVYIIDLITKKVVHTIKNVTPASMAFSHGNQYLALGDSNGIRLVDLTTGKETLVNRGEGNNYIASVCFSPDDRLFAVAEFGAAIKLYDLKTKKCIAELSGHMGRVTCLAFSPDGTKLVSGSDDTTALIWDVAAILRPKTPANPDTF
ncbi:MAG: WD40 repeat domain-containing protein [Candidatus Acidiferrales bacterium]